ncbi:hypothetical protein, partial [Mycobacteroides abscessus]|uniref:hypothetical protein n=1 Tax=Mycobacteroides abscessus TaxID=36809 RepID=UPI001F3ACE5D
MVASVAVAIRAEVDGETGGVGGFGISPGPLTAVAVPDNASAAPEVSGMPEAPRLETVLTTPET